MCHGLHVWGHFRFECIGYRLTFALVKLYLAALGGARAVFFWVVVLTLFVITNFTYTLQTWFLGYWATQYEDHPAAEVNIGL